MSFSRVLDVMHSLGAGLLAWSAAAPGAMVSPAFGNVAQHDDQIAAKLIVLKVDTLDANEALRSASDAVRAIDGVLYVGWDAGRRLLSMITTQECPLTTGAAIENLREVNIQVVDGDEDDYDHIERMLQEGVIELPRDTAAGREAENVQAPNRQLKAAPELRSLQDSVQPLVDHFNAAKGKVRFITLLSPT